MNEDGCIHKHDLAQWKYHDDENEMKDCITSQTTWMTPTYPADITA